MNHNRPGLLLLLLLLSGVYGCGQEPERGVPGDPCIGVTCDGELSCNPFDKACIQPDGLPPCPVPQAPGLSEIHRGAVLVWTVDDPELRIQVGVAADPLDDLPEEWLDSDRLTMDQVGSTRVFARSLGSACLPVRSFELVYQVVESYPGPPGEEDSTAIPLDSPLIKGWATGWVEPVDWGEGLTEAWMDPSKALGPAEGRPGEVVSLGRGGSLTLTFEPPVSDNPGWDLAVFENSFRQDFLELAAVEVSSDGVNFTALPGVSLWTEPVASFGTTDARLIGTFVGRYPMGWGAPLDLGVLGNHPSVLDKTLDLDRVTHVRLVDIVGDGSLLDCLGNPVFDPFPTVESAGFDLDGVAVLGLEP